MAVKTKPRRDPDAVRRDQLAKGIRPLWVLLPGGKPTLVSATRRDLLAGSVYYCREGDREWRPISELDFKEEGAAVA